MEDTQPQTQPQTPVPEPSPTEVPPVENKEEKGKAGRPPSTPEEITARKALLLQRIEPYLKTGLSVNKALHEAQIANSEFYEYMGADEDFRERINTFRQFVAVLLNNAIVTELQGITRKQNEYTYKVKDKNGKEVEKVHTPEPLTKEDKNFLWKFALNSNLTKAEFGERKDINLFDPEAEIQKVKSLLEAGSTKEIDHSKEVVSTDD